MDIAYFRKYSNSTNIEISFYYKNSSIGIEREFNLNRNIDEPIEQSLERIRINLEKGLRKKGGNKKKKAKQSDQTESTAENTILVVSLLNENQEPVKDVKWCDLFKTECASRTNFTLRMLEQDYSIVYNFPYVKFIALPSVLMVGFYCYPAKIEVHFAERDDCIFEWFHGIPKEKGDDNSIEWSKCGEAFFYDIKETDVRHKLKLECTPRKGDLLGQKAVIISKCLIELGPGFSAFEVKQSFTSNRLPLESNKFRVVTYNLLADYYADSDFSRKELFPYCPPYALAIDYRKLIFIKEIIGYYSDVICLQEVDSKVFDLDLTVCLGHEGFSGTYQKKGDTAEGLATFYHKDKFSLIEKYGINLGENITVLSHFNDLYQKIKDNAKLCERMLALSTSLQVTVLRCNKTNNYLLVANTHLYFHPDADHIRLLQIGFFMLYVKFIYYKTIGELDIAEKNISIIFCGDFNSVPECGIYKLMTENEVPEDFIDYKSNADEAVTEVLLQQPFNIRSAYNNPKYTNFTVGFAACLDYIFYQTDNLELDQAVPLPSEEELKALIAIPSLYFPSDHISLVADFKWTKQSE